MRLTCDNVYSSALAFCDFTWNPDIPKRIVAVSTDNAIRVINPVTGRILKSVLVNPPKPTLNGVVYAPHLGNLPDIKHLKLHTFLI